MDIIVALTTARASTAESSGPGCIELFTNDQFNPLLPQVDVVLGKR